MSTNGSNTSTKSKEWGKWLERRIELSELTRQQFADRAGVAKSTVSRWINGDRPSAKQVDGVADALWTRNTRDVVYGLGGDWAVKLLHIYSVRDILVTDEERILNNTPEATPGTGRNQK